jgi:hypothetical protein
MIGTSGSVDFAKFPNSATGKDDDSKSDGGWLSRRFDLKAAT